MRRLLIIAFGFALFPAGLFAACVGTSCNATSTKDTAFTQNLYVDGTVAKGSGTFIIDHPLDPKNWILYHSFFESPDMKNLYDGIATLNENGEATIMLPDYFMALNHEYRYLASGVSGPMPDLHLLRGVRREWFFGAPSFRLAGGTASGKVSWQVTGIRKDAFALARPIIVEVPKEGSPIVSPGKYLFPEYYEKLPL